MTSNPDVEPVVRRRRYRLHCACGVTVAASAKTAICSSCGATIVFRGNRTRRQRASTGANPAAQEMLLLFGALLLFALVAGLFGLGWAILGSVLAAAGIGALRGDAASRAKHRRIAPNYEKRYLTLGLLFLLLAAFIALIPVSRTDMFRERVAVLSTPAPRDCNWSALPLGDKHCHYVAVLHRVEDNGLERVLVTWNRVDD